MSKVIELYTCSICGITNETERHWGPVCKMTRKRVCLTCCMKCEHQNTWSGLMHCTFVTEEERRAEAVKRQRLKFDAEVAAISRNYRHHKKEQARLRAIKDARMRQRYEREKSNE